MRSGTPEIPFIKNMMDDLKNKDVDDEDVAGEPDEDEFDPDAEDDDVDLADDWTKEEKEY